MADWSESFAFTGTSLDLIMWCGPDRGQASVVITTPGQPDVVQTIDTYSAGAGDKTFAADWRALLREHGGWLSGLVASKELLRGFGGEDSGFVKAAHALDLQVDAWTFRDDQLGKGHASISEELAAAMELGVDALFCDFPATALSVRASLSAG